MSEGRTTPTFWLADRRGPAIVGVLTALAVWWVWAATAGVPVMHDEWAYWLQAGQYAHGAWSQAAPVIPEFFEQMYVLVTPVFAAKYPPGHAIVIALGFMLGWPMLMPLVLSGLTGGLVFALARRVRGGGVALATWLFWLGTFGNLRWRASYFSEVTSSLCWLVAWWALLEWRASRRRAPMVVLALSIGWCAVTRPYTAVALAIPIAGVVIVDLVRLGSWRGNWRDTWRESVRTMAIGIATGTMVLLVLPLWSWRTTGNMKETPLATYTRQYLPFDVPGLRVDLAPPERAVPAEMEQVRAFLRGVKEQQVREPFVRTIAWRTLGVALHTFDAWRLPLLVCFLIGLAALGAPGWLALGTGILLIVSYGVQAHSPDWTLYYLEALPALAYATACGARRLLALTSAGLRVAPFAAVLVAGLVVRDIGNARKLVGRLSEGPRTFVASVAALPKRPNVVFVRYAPDRGAGSLHLSLVANDGVLDTAPSWIVHDRGNDNRRLLLATPNRTAYLYDESTRTFSEIAR